MGINSLDENVLTFLVRFFAEEYDAFFMFITALSVGAAPFCKVGGRRQYYEFIIPSRLLTKLSYHLSKASSLIKSSSTASLSSPPEILCITVS